jgi:RND family efflux transporter MFP subunit
MSTISQLLKTTAVRVALAVVALIIVGAGAYYLIESQPPKVAYASVTTGNITEDVTGTGVVTPVQNPTLSFEMGGKVTGVHASVGEKVSAGSLLATLDTSVLNANLEAAEAKLNELEAGPRSVDLAGQQTAVSNAQQTLTNTYATYPDTLQSTFSKAQEAITTQVDPYFGSEYRETPTLTFDTVNESQKVTIDEERAEINTELSTWQAQIANATSSPSVATLQTITSESLAHLTTIQSFLNDYVNAIDDAQIGVFTQQQQTAALASANAARDTVNGLITSLTTANQSIGNEQLAIQSAQDQLSDTSAGADSQDIEAQQAAVQAIEAQIAQQEIVAPFSGTIASVSIKSGDVVQANTAAISLIPTGTFEVDVYLAENDATKVKVGAPVDVTLDAYGTGRTFPATVSSIDSSPSTDPTDSTLTGYKATLIFTNADPAIANGMHANVTIHAGSVQNVLIVPKSAVITSGSESFVLKQTSSGLVQTPVTIGLSSTDYTQIVSGLSAGDSVSSVGSQ